MILWVDSEDLNWQRKLEHYSKGSNKTSNDFRKSRYRCLGMLKYIFRSIDNFMPWVRKIHLVTEGHLPDWLDTKDSRLNIVTHNDIFSRVDDLPTFNSNAIESNLDLIKGLSERFILFNDDTIVLQPVSQSRFFIRGLPVDFLELSIPRPQFFYRFIRKSNALNVSVINNCLRHLRRTKAWSNFRKSEELDQSSRLVYKIFRKYSWIKINHVPQPHLKSTISYFRENQQLLQQTSKHRFRNANDISHYVHRYFNLLMGDFVGSNSYKHDSLSIEIKSKSDLNRLEAILKKNRLVLLSVSDSEILSEKDFKEMVEFLSVYFEKLIPRKCSFEL
ncbi:hypothetical protein JCM19231_2496 [Vibrio ishigakensis]|uniref:Stealth protein CR2 conserved region 2 domain-containing protein n=1 Tax=Vibrio ishigakensis TaxID=1481914 RepID=A0A0B8NVC3_9VIBR|nr:hypothetical protein JCM19231_2496 [Vibrio ishigakensis]